ncbi:MAG: hypothetical protein ACK5TK_16005, partial [Betaproteobacteria bacterium]
HRHAIVRMQIDRAIHCHRRSPSGPLPVALRTQRTYARSESRLDDSQARAAGGHVERPTPLADHIELESPQRFHLRGRHADAVNIAGKRSSLAYLDQVLRAVPGVVDGAFFLVEAAGAAGERVAAAVVAPSLDLAALRQALRQHLDPVFLPRPLLRVEALPRNEAGKLPRERLLALLSGGGAREHRR